ncbi:spore coat protein [Terribacillus sp. DMT04]|uniref:spore coat protein n=1 Tax=Terribacillus sp. DMT04 TaxID=2850441 RepID=UPI001C2C4D66|nr:spore coat protein [Terribacillus sp. DMT04]QXE02872.1 spore coat protein [Terribacillus sp. DMT04]
MKEQPLSVADRGIATDLLFKTKASIKDLSAVISETTTGELHELLTDELHKAIQQHEKIYGFLQDRGIYDAYRVPHQLEKDSSYIAEALERSGGMQ